MMMEQFRDKLSWSDFAILYRSNAQSRAFEEKLRMERIPYVVIGGQQFYERKEVKDAIAYLRVIDNPGDEASLLRIINFPRRGIGDTTLLRLNQWSMEQDCPLFEALRRVNEITGMSESSRKTVTAFHTMMKGVIDGFDMRSRLGAQTNALFNRLRIEDEIYRTLNDASQAKKRIENIEQIVNSLAIFEEHNPKAGLSEFLERISLMDEQESDDDKEHGQNAVTLMSLHSSKGLEFDHVYLVGMEEELLPHKRSIEEDPHCAEERRLCYVGITRARKHLTISRCLTRRKYGAVEERKPSRFLAEIPGHLLCDTSGSAESNKLDSANIAEDFFARMLGDLP
jgi:superfamily I DNA/RNA helicase